MNTAEKRGLTMEMADRLVELYVRRDEARRDDNWRELRHLQHQIEEIAAQRNELLDEAGEG
jgi:hypothetical protein